MPKYLAAPVARPCLAIVGVGCTLLVGCGSTGQNRDLRPHVLYREQATGSMDCSPASVLMWRL